MRAVDAMCDGSFSSSSLPRDDFRSAIPPSGAPFDNFFLFAADSMRGGLVFPPAAATPPFLNWLLVSPGAPAES